MAENLEYKSCLQKDSAEHERYAGVPRSIPEYGRNGTVHKRKTDTPRSRDGSEIYQSVYVNY